MTSTVDKTIFYLQSKYLTAQKLTKKKQSKTSIMQAVRIHESPLNFNHQETTK